MRLLMVGAGYVGLATGVGLASHGHSVQVVERDPARRAALRERRVPFHEPSLDDALRALPIERFSIPEPAEWTAAADVAFICVGTPSASSGELDTSEVLNAGRTITYLAGHDEPPVVAIRSTVPPGTSRMLAQAINRGRRNPVRVVSHPEFLREGTALDDFERPARRVIGGDVAEAVEVVASLYEFSDAPILRTDATTAELIKLGANAMLAVRVSVVNELADLAASLDVDLGEMFEGIGMDPRIGPDFLRPGIGFGGSCLPKDLDAMRASLRSAGGRANVFDAAAATNDQGLERLLERVRQLTTQGEHIGIVGVGFKPDTDSIRGSRSLRFVQMLLAAGYRVDVFDPLAEANVREVLGNRVRYLATPEEILESSRLVVLSHGRQELPLDVPARTIVLDGLGQIVA